MATTETGTGNIQHDIETALTVRHFRPFQYCFRLQRTLETALAETKNDDLRLGFFNAFCILCFNSQQRIIW